VGFGIILEKNGNLGNRRIIFDFSGVDHGSLSKTSAGSKRVPAYSVINKKIDYQYNKDLHKFMPVIGETSFYSARSTLKKKRCNWSI